MRINPSYPDVWYAKGIALNAVKRYEEAIRAFDFAIRANPHDVMALERKSRALKALGRDAEADAAHPM